MRSPSLLRMVISSTATAGKVPGRLSIFLSRSIRPSSSSSLSTSFSSALVSPLMPKALAISRLEARSGFSLRKRRMVSLSGMSPRRKAGRASAAAPSLFRADGLPVPGLRGGCPNVSPSLPWRLPVFWLLASSLQPASWPQLSAWPWWPFWPAPWSSCRRWQPWRRSFRALPRP